MDPLLQRLLLLLLLSYAACGYATFGLCGEHAAVQAETESALSAAIRQEGPAIVVTVTNAAGGPIEIVDRFEPEFGVVCFEITDSAGNAVSTQGSASDWLLFGPQGTASETVTIPSDGMVERTIPLQLPPGRYRIRMTYSVQPTSFFLEPWLKEQILGSPDFRSRMKERAQKIWCGTIRSPVIMVEWTEGNQPSPATQ